MSLLQVRSLRVCSVDILRRMRDVMVHEEVTILSPDMIQSRFSPNIVLAIPRLSRRHNVACFFWLIYYRVGLPWAVLTADD